MKKTNLQKTEFIKEAVHAQAHAVPAAIAQSQVDSPDAWYNKLGLQILERTYDLPSGILKHLIAIESKGNPKAKSHRGAMGLFQIMPYSQSGFSGNPYDPIQAAQFAAQKISRDAKELGGYKHALAAWNWGRHNVINHGIENLPAETHKFLDHFKRMGVVADELIPDEGW